MARRKKKKDDTTTAGRLSAAIRAAVKAHAEGKERALNGADLAYARAEGIALAAEIIGAQVDAPRDVLREIKEASK